MTTIIPVSSGHQIEFLDGEYFPMKLRDNGSGFCYFSSHRNGQACFKSEKGARAFLAKHGHPVRAIAESVAAAEETEEQDALSSAWTALQETPSYIERGLADEWIATWAEIENSLADFAVGEEKKPITKMLCGTGSAMTTFDREAGTLDFVRGEQHFSLSNQEVSALLQHLSDDLRESIYEVQHRDFYRKYV